MYFIFIEVVWTIQSKCQKVIYLIFPHQRSQGDRRTAGRLKDLQQELEWSLEECKRLKAKLTKTETELQNTVEE